MIGEEMLDERKIIYTATIVSGKKKMELTAIAYNMIKLYMDSGLQLMQAVNTILWKDQDVP